MRVGGGGVLRLSRTWGLSRETEIRKLSQKGENQNGGDQRRLAWNTAAVKGGEG